MESRRIVMSGKQKAVISIISVIIAVFVVASSPMPLSAQNGPIAYDIYCENDFTKSGTIILRAREARQIGKLVRACRDRFDGKVVRVEPLHKKGKKKPPKKGKKKSTKKG